MLRRAHCLSSVHATQECLGTDRGKKRTGLPRRPDGVVWHTLVVVLHVFIFALHCIGCVLEVALAPTALRSLNFCACIFSVRDSPSPNGGASRMYRGILFYLSSVHPQTASALKVNARTSLLHQCHGSWQVTSCGPNKPHPHE